MLNFVLMRSAFCRGGHYIRLHVLFSVRSRIFSAYCPALRGSILLPPRHPSVFARMARWQLLNANTFKVLLRRKFLFLFPSFFNINLLYMFKIIQIAKNWNDTCVRGLEISHWKVRKYRPPLQSSQSNSPRDLRKAVVRLTTWFMHCDVETSTKRFAFGKSLWV